MIIVAVVTMSSSPVPHSPQLWVLAVLVLRSGFGKYAK